MSGIDPKDLLIEAWPDRGKGGQHVGMQFGIKVTHLPSGLVAFCENERSQHRNMRVAHDMILGGITSPHFRG